MPRTGLTPANGPASRRVAELYLRAEIAVFPLCSEKSFKCHLIELDPRLNDEATCELWRECERAFAPHTHWSLDSLVAARDRSWFGSCDGLKRVRMHDYLDELARSHLVKRAGVTELLDNTELSTLDAAKHYHWLTLSMPEDLLMAGLDEEPAPMPPLLVRRLLDLGVAEIHQHVGAGMDFPLLWVSALAALATPDVPEDHLVSPGAPLSDGRFLVRWLLAAAVARCAF